MTSIRKLSTKKHWDDNYQEQLDNKIYFKKKRFLSYSETLFWIIINKYLPKCELKILEVGSAPGIKLVEFHKKMGYKPYGIEYSLNGCELNKEIFKANNCNPKNVLQKDFLSDEFQNEYTNSFDIVSSFGFIEHFDNVEAIIDKHHNLLKKDGYLLITIPNFKGINLYLSNYFTGKELMEMHNLHIMDIDVFNRLFENKNINKIYSGYFGIFDFFLIYYSNSEGSVKTILYHTLYLMNICLSTLFKLLEKVNLNNKLENKNFSPSLIYIGKKL